MKTILTILLLISQLTYAQERATKAPRYDSPIHTITYDDMDSNITSRIEIIKDGKIIKEINVLKTIGFDYGVNSYGFSLDSKKLYIGSQSVMFEYDIATGQKRSMFEDFNEENKSVEFIGCKEDYIVVRRLRWENGWLRDDIFYKYKDGVYSDYIPHVYYSMSLPNNPLVVDGVKYDGVNENKIRKMCDERNISSL